MSYENLTGAVRKFAGKRVAVIGDLMLDSYVWGRVERISPEAPVPVVRVDRCSIGLGGAGNVLRNIATLGGAASSFGIVGADADAETMLGEFASCSIDASGVVADPGRRTTVKRRILAGGQQLLRVDYEDSSEISAEARARVTSEAVRRIAGGEFQAVVIEDYAKGLLSEEMAQRIVDTARTAGVPVILDPKPRHRMNLHGLTLIKPNRSEAYAMAGLPCPDAPDTPESLREVANRIRETWGTENLLISLAAQGMALFEKDELTMLPTRAREVFDVTGAGDTVIAAVALGFAAGVAPVPAAMAANYAAGIVVGKLGTVGVSASELIAELEGNRGE